MAHKIEHTNITRDISLLRPEGVVEEVSLSEQPAPLQVTDNSASTRRWEASLAGEHIKSGNQLMRVFCKVLSLLLLMMLGYALPSETTATDAGGSVITDTYMGRITPRGRKTSQSGVANTAESDGALLAEQYRVSIVAAGTEEAELREIRDQSLQLLQSKEFRANLLSLKNAENKVVSAVSASQPQFVTFEELADTVALRNKAFHKFRSHFVLLGTYFNTGKVYTGKCTLGSTTKDCKAYEFEDNRDNEFVATRVVTLGADSILESVIGRKIHERWRTDSLDRKSCAINTFSHEIMHAFSKRQLSEYHENFFVDTLELNRATQYGNYPIATHLVGSVAQCTWLQQRGRVALNASAFSACVNRFGVNEFKSNECK